MQRIILLILCILGGCMAEAVAGTFYVAHYGSNSNPGTIDQPWSTISYAVSASSGVSAGDTIYVRGDNYPETVVPAVSGTADAPIVLSSYGSEVVTMDPGRFRFEDGINYWEITGFITMNSADNGLRVTGTHALGFLTVNRCTFSHHKEDGISLGGPDFGGVTISSCDIEWNGEQNGIPCSSGGSGIVMYGSQGKLWARHNYIANNWAKGIAHGSEGAFQGDSSVIEHNYIINNYETGMDWLADNSYILYNYFSSNGVRDPEAGEWGDTGLALASVTSGNIVAFNVIKSSGQMELSPRGSYNKYYNNTIIKDHYYTTVPGSPYAAAIIMFGSNGVGNEFRNNIIINLCSESQHHFAIIAESYERYMEQVWSNNLYWCPNATDPPPANRPFKLYGFPGGTYVTLEQIQSTFPDYEIGSLWADPKFVAYADSNFELAQGSPAIDAGIYLGYPYKGEAPDLGCFEYAGTRGQSVYIVNRPKTPTVRDQWEWQIREKEQVVRADSFRLHLSNWTVPDGFAAFQICGGGYETWREVSGTEELVFPLLPNSRNLLRLRVRYLDGHLGPERSVLIIEDSTPPAPPSGLKAQQIAEPDSNK